MKRLSVLWCIALWPLCVYSCDALLVLNRELENICQIKYTAFYQDFFGKIDKTFPADSSVLPDREVGKKMLANPSTPLGLDYMAFEGDNQMKIEISAFLDNAISLLSRLSCMVTGGASVCQIDENKLLQQSNMQELRALLQQLRKVAYPVLQLKDLPGSLTGKALRDIVRKHPRFREFLKKLFSMSPAGIVTWVRKRIKDIVQCMAICNTSSTDNLILSCIIVLPEDGFKKRLELLDGIELWYQCVLGIDRIVDLFSVIQHDEFFHSLINMYDPSLLQDSYKAVQVAINTHQSCKDSWLKCLHERSIGSLFVEGNFNAEFFIHIIFDMY